MSWIFILIARLPTPNPNNFHMMMNQANTAPVLAVPDSVPRVKLPLTTSAADPVHKIEHCLYVPPIGKAGGVQEEPPPRGRGDGITVRAVRKMCCR